MTVKEMSQLYYLNREIVQLERQLEELECLAESTAQVITGMPHGGGTSDKVGRYAVRIADSVSYTHLTLPTTPYV